MHLISAILCFMMALTAVYQDPFFYQWNKKSTLNTEGQVEFPSIILEPGTYVVRLEEGGDRRGIIKILNQSETQVLATVYAVPDHLAKPDDNSEFTFHELKTAGPRAVHSWFAPGEMAGWEFVYPKVRAQEIA